MKLTRLSIIVVLQLMLTSQTLLMTTELLASDYSSSRSSQKSSESRSKQKVISKKSAINVAKSEVRGKVLSAKLINSKGPAVYRVKMLVGDSRIRTIFVDGVRGRVIRIN